MKFKMPFIIVLALIMMPELFGQKLPKQKPNITDVNGNKQGEWVTWINKNWEKTNNPELVMYYEKCFFKDDVPIGKTYCYYRSGKIQFEGNAISYNPAILDGKCTYYYPSGFKQMEGSYDKGTPTGLWLFYKNDGTIEKRIDFSLDYARKKIKEAEKCFNDKKYEEAKKIYIELE